MSAHGDHLGRGHLQRGQRPLEEQPCRVRIAIRLSYRDVEELLADRFVCEAAQRPVVGMWEAAAFAALAFFADRFSLSVLPTFLVLAF